MQTGQLGVSADGKPTAVVSPEEAEIARLKAEVVRLNIERDIAKNVHRDVAPIQWRETRICPT